MRHTPPKHGWKRWCLLERGSELLQQAGLVLVAVGVGLFVGALLGPVAGVGVALVVFGAAVVVFGVVKEREVTDGTSSTVART